MERRSRQSRTSNPATSCLFLNVFKSKPTTNIIRIQDTGDVVYGTDRGSLGHLAPAPRGAEFLCKTWEIPAGGGLGGGGGVGRGVTALKRCDLTEDGVAEIVAGREDGTVSVSIGGTRALRKGLTGTIVRPWVVAGAWITPGGSQPRKPRLYGMILHRKLHFECASNNTSQSSQTKY